MTPTSLLPQRPLVLGLLSTRWSPIRSGRARAKQPIVVLRAVHCYASSPPSSSPSPPSSLYAVLGVDRDVSPSAIKSAYRQMARLYHPDVCRGSDVEACTHKFLAVQEAYEILSDPERRADYDFKLLHPFCAQAFGKGGFRSNIRMSQRRGKGAQARRSEVSAGWKLQWEAQISMLKLRRGRRPFVAGTKSWAAKSGWRGVQNARATAC